MKNPSLQAYFERQESEFEAMCLRCGDCCGVNDDPCQNLAADPNGRMYCRDYENRLGPQKTISGKKFRCVSIREHIAKERLSLRCGYRRLLNSNR